MSDDCDDKNEFASWKVEKKFLNQLQYSLEKNNNFKASFAYMNEEKGKKAFK